MAKTVPMILGAIAVLVLASFPWSHPWIELLLILILLGMILGNWGTLQANWKGAGL